MNIQHFLFLFLVIGLVLIFSYMPQIDLYISALFYHEGQGFYLKTNPIILFIYHFTRIFAAGFGLIVMFLAIKKYLLVRSFKLKHYKVFIYLTLFVILGPGIIVHSVLKDQVGRPRPHQVEQFGGHNVFQPPFAISNICRKNCSFVSGHASAGFMLYGPGFLYKGRRRAYWFVGGTVLGAIFGLGRIIQGAHFLSDIVFAGVVVFITAYILAQVIKPERA